MRRQTPRTKEQPVNPWDSALRRERYRLLRAHTKFIRERAYSSADEAWRAVLRITAEIDRISQ